LFTITINRKKLHLSKWRFKWSSINVSETINMKTSI